MSSYPTCNKEFQKNNKKKKNTIMASFQTKIGWERLRKRKNKKKSFRWVPTRPVIENLRKNSKKIDKIWKRKKKDYYGIFSSQNKLGKAEKERK